MANSSIYSWSSAARSYTTAECFLLRQETYDFSKSEELAYKGKTGKDPWDIAAACWNDNCLWYATSPSVMMYSRTWSENSLGY